MQRRGRNKDEILSALLRTALKLDLEIGHLRWTLSQVARECGVSRPLIYYYLGPSRLKILIEAVKFVGDKVTPMFGEQSEIWNQTDLTGAIRSSRRFLHEVPGALLFYRVHRDDLTELGDMIRKVEKEYAGRLLAKYFPGVDTVAAQAIFALLLGLLSTPDLSEEVIASGLQILTGGGLSSPPAGRDQARRRTPSQEIDQ
jgi:AcrR family transcriptional regulator